MLALNTLRGRSLRASISTLSTVHTTSTPAAYQVFTVSLPLKYSSFYNANNKNVRLFSSSSSSSSSSITHSPSTRTTAASHEIPASATTAEHAVETHHHSDSHGHHDTHHGEEPPKETWAERETRSTKWYTPRGIFYRLVYSRFYRVLIPQFTIFCLFIFGIPMLLEELRSPPLVELALEKVLKKGGYEPIPWITEYPITPEEIRRRELVEVVEKALPILIDNPEYKEKLRTSRLEDLEKTVEVLKRLQSENRRFHLITEEEIDQLEEDLYNKYKDFRMIHVVDWDDAKIESFAHELNDYYRRMRRLRRSLTFVLE